MGISKVVPRGAVAALRKRYAGQTMVFTNGCFDLLHVGHVRYLQEARNLGDHLVVGLNSDRSVRVLKGAGRPLQPELERAEILAALEAVGSVVIFDEPRVTSLLQEIQPQIYAKGGDYTLASLDPAELAVLRRLGAHVRILPLVPGRSTSTLLERLRPG